MSGCLLHVFVWGGFGVVFFFSLCVVVSLFFLPGTDFLLKKHSNQRGGFTDTVLRVRSASIIKMVNTGHRQERLRRVSFFRFLLPISCPFFFLFLLRLLL
jgi:hypothetical protein